MKGHRTILAGLIWLIHPINSFSQTAPPAVQEASNAYDYLTPAPIIGVQARPYYVNWGDLPFKLSISKSVGYNDNILGAFQGQPLPNGVPARGDLFSTTLFGASTKFMLGPQQFFVDGSYGFTKYRIDEADNTSQYSIDGGVNWTLTSRCSGRLIAAANEYQSPIDQLVGTGINTVTAFSFNETANCLISSYVSAIIDSGWSTNQNSQAVNALNNY